MRKTGFDIGAGSPERLGATATADGCNFAVYSRHAERIEICLFDAAGEQELRRLALPDRHGDVHCGFIAGLLPASRYGLRAYGPFDPSGGHRFDPSKLLVDPYALAIDRPFVFSTDLSLPPDRAVDTDVAAPAVRLHGHDGHQ